MRVASNALWHSLPGVVAAYQPVAASDAIAARQNVGAYMRRLGLYTATPGVAPTWTARTGWMFDLAGSQYLTTGLVGGNAYSAIVRFSDCTGQALFGEYTVGQTNLNIFHNFGGTSYFRSGGSFDQAVTYSTAVLGVTPASAYANGVAVGNLAGPVSGTTTSAILIGGLNVNNTPGNYLDGNMQAVAIYSRTLTAAEVWLASRQMAYCDTVPEFNAWARRRQYWIPASLGAARILPQLATLGGVSAPGLSPRRGM